MWVEVVVKLWSVSKLNSVTRHLWKCSLSHFRMSSCDINDGKLLINQNFVNIQQWAFYLLWNNIKGDILYMACLVNKYHQGALLTCRKIAQLKWLLEQKIQWSCWLFSFSVVKIQWTKWSYVWIRGCTLWQSNVFVLFIHFFQSFVRNLKINSSCSILIMGLYLTIFNSASTITVGWNCE